MAPPKYSRSVMDYGSCFIILLLARIIYGPPSLFIKAANIVSFGLFAYDKYQGLNHGYRVSENMLFLSSLLGGWIGGVCAMLILRHKTFKNSFIGTMGVIAVVNVLAVAKLRGLF